jgi:hypothetical protein
MDRAEVLRLVDAHTTGRAFGFLGEDAVNVLELNLDQRAPVARTSGVPAAVGDAPIP